MKNYAIVLGVSKYKNAQDLFACENDAQIMYDLLQATEKYDILKIPGNLTKHEVLERIKEFLPDENKEKNIGEILFYYSGHGCRIAFSMLLKSLEIFKINKRQALLS